MSTKPIVDYHIVYAVALITVVLAGVGATWGLGHWWATLPVVRDHAWLRCRPLELASLGGSHPPARPGEKSAGS